MRREQCDRCGGIVDGELALVLPDDPQFDAPTDLAETPRIAISLESYIAIGSDPDAQAFVTAADGTLEGIVVIGSLVHVVDDVAGELVWRVAHPAPDDGYLHLVWPD